MWPVWKPPHLLPLLRAAAQDRRDLPLATFDEGRLQWALETGLGPLLFRVTQEDPHAAASPLWPLVRGADLTARLLAAEQHEALSEVLAACAGRVERIVLLKGIALATHQYPAPSLRPMRDLDVLVDEHAVPTMAAILRQLGYEQPDAQGEQPREFVRRHHAPPFFHPRRQVWMEVHWKLFSSLSGFAQDPLFRRDRVWTQCTPSNFQGYPVLRVRPELQLAYSAAHWQRQYSALHVVGAVFALLDVLYVLRTAEPAVHWERLLGLLHGSAAASPLYLLLTYLDRRGLVTVPPAALRALAHEQRTFNALTLTLVHTLMDRFIVDGEAPGSLLNERNLPICWETLLLPGPPYWNLALLPWRLLPSRAGLRARLAHLMAAPDGGAGE